MKCLIVAAGQGTRLREKGGLKPLIPVRGVALIEHVVARALRAGIDEFFVVTGFRSEDLQAALTQIAARQATRITPIFNHEWRRANGVSLLAAKPFLAERFLLTMCDHLIDPEITRGLIASSDDPEGVTLAVDFKTASALNDPDDVTRVLCADGRIQDIGKSIASFNAFDTGAFLCTPAIFAALEASQARGDDSISGAMRVLAGWRRAYVHDIGDRIWVDVDDPAAFGTAERLLDSGAL